MIVGTDTPNWALVSLQVGAPVMFAILAAQAWRESARSNAPQQRAARRRLALNLTLMAIGFAVAAASLLAGGVWGGGGAAIGAIIALFGALRLETFAKT